MIIVQKFLRLLLTVRAQAVKIKPVRHDTIAGLAAHFRTQAVKAQQFRIHNFSALRADDMLLITVRRCCRLFILTEIFFYTIVRIIKLQPEHFN